MTMSEGKSPMIASWMMILRTTSSSIVSRLCVTGAFECTTHDWTGVKLCVLDDGRDAVEG